MAQLLLEQRPDGGWYRLDTGARIPDELAAMLAPEPEPEALPERCVRCSRPVSELDWPLCPTCSAAPGPTRTRCACGGRISKAAQERREAKCATCRRAEELAAGAPPLSDEQASRLRTLLSTSINATSDEEPKREAPPAKPDQVKCPIRLWARENGRRCDRGRIPFATIRAWRAANPDAPERPEEARMLRTEPESRRRAAPDPRSIDHGPSTAAGRELLAAAMEPVPPSVPIALPPSPLAPPPRPAPEPVGFGSGHLCAGGCGRVVPPTRERCGSCRLEQGEAARDGISGRRCVRCRTLLARSSPYDRCGSCRSVQAAPLAVEDDDPHDAGIPSRLSGVVLDRLPGEIVLSDGERVELRINEPARDSHGRILCRGCTQPISQWFACGCDEGELDDDGHPLDPRWASGSFLPGPLEAAS